MKKILVLALALLALFQAQAGLQVPAFTAYLDPNGKGATVSPAGITDWKNSNVKVLWFGELTNLGKLTCSVMLRLPASYRASLRLSLAGQSHVANVIGQSNAPVQADFGTFDISAPGYQRFTLMTLDENGLPQGTVDSLILDGLAAKDARFNLAARRNAASVHLNYPLSGVTNVERFYCEVTAVADPVWTYYMACGWRRGYMGMQVNSPTERRIIFSVWDSGSEPVDRHRVETENRVTLVAKGDGVVAGDFGNEGTGGHSHLVFPWKTGEKQRFLVTAQPVDATHTIYSGFYFRPDREKWMLISSWKAPKDGAWLGRLYSFNEDFIGDNGELRRKALFGNQWVCTADGRWIELTRATFSHDATGRDQRLDRFMGIENGQFFLSNGGFIAGSTKFGEEFKRPSTSGPPADILSAQWPD